ncbi:UDP-N-acetylglucosamine 2-epimerase (hydrolyzing) [Sphingomonas sp. R-74633]|uniref:UDP-N-acetylglucosamine 2-epimerase n=1 Tax=Sphingomonas sp. R-74633 TaxID=2751188 RepID=UPI0015D27619|nr:UDP-N-acetylglucosamine 2-epimerase [Sphingomonas sp. R-74633]NYT39218.1 UDP-N-acetylglucosamine 2-epimerase (hydrolyzing) [Sphingomonas sp. R-74633]
MSKSKKLILGVTGIRSEYDIMSSVFGAIERHPALDLKIIATGAHLSEAYGRTIDEIRADGFEIADEVHSLLNGDDPACRVKGLGIQLQGLVQAVNRINPDMLIVLGDREESMTTALVGAYMNIAVAHISGGDRVVGNVDDQVRHAVTKLAHLHFATSAPSAERILRLGEQPERVFNVGNPGLDRLLEVPELSSSELSARLGIEISDDKPLLAVIQHALSTEIGEAYQQMRATLEAVRELQLPTVLSYPNSDAGGQQMIRAIQEFGDLPFLYTAENIPRLEFVNLLRRASCLLGNSSAGILEAPLLKLPVVNVGNRQTGRLNAGNVEFVPHDVAAIVAAVKKAIYDTDYRAMVAACQNPYGDGHSSARIAEIIASTPIDEALLIKDITY